MAANNNTLDRMASYNFKAPIDIVYFEENSNDEVDLTNSPKSKNEDNTKIVIDIDLNNTESEVNINKSSDPTDNKKEEVGKLKSVAESKKRKINEENSHSVLNNDDTSKRTKTGCTNNISDGLKNVSKYLTLILESLNHYMTTVRNGKSTSHDVTLAKKSFLSIKYHFFKAAYEHVNSYILPNENNQAFIHNFLTHTIDNATKRIKIDCNKGITEIYLELMSWVKQRKSKDLNDKTPILKTHLSNPPIIPDVTISESSIIPIEPSPTDADQDTFCIFSSGSPGRQVNINIDKSLMTYKTLVQGNINSSPNNTLLQNTNSMPQNTSILLQHLNTPPNFHNIISQSRNFSFRNTNSVNTYGDRQVYNQSVARQNNLIRPIVPTNEYLITAENRLPHYVPPQSRQSLVSENNQVRNNYVSSNTQPNAYYNYCHTTKNFQNNTYYGANNLTHGRNGYIPNAAIYEDGSLRTFRKDHNVPRMDMRVPPPPYHSPVAVPLPSYDSPVAVHSSQMMQPVPTIPTALPDLLNGPDLTRSSVSTDSGFVSPVQSKSTGNPLEDIMNDLFELENTIQPPKRPARSTTQVICHVCHQNAKLMCSACYKTSYCNTKCQKLDWEVHRRFCPPPEKRML